MEANDGAYQQNIETTKTKNKNFSNGLITIISVAGFILLALGTIIFLYNQNQNLKEKLSEYQAVPMATQTTSPTPQAEILDGPVISSPSARSKIKSPLKVTGTVPAGWMFEGVFPVKILDSKQNVVAQAQAKEVEPGSWQNGNPVDFTTTLTFKAATGSGTLVLENDNPSGNPENIKTFEVPITF